MYCMYMTEEYTSNMLHVHACITITYYYIMIAQREGYADQAEATYFYTKAYATSAAYLSLAY